MKKINIILLLLLTLSFNSFGFEKVGVTSFQFLKISPDPRIASMGGAYAAISQGTASLYGNPAALVYQQGLGTFISQTDYMFDTQHTSVAASWGFGGFAVGVYGMSIDYGSIAVTNIANLGFVDGVFNPGLTGESLTLGATDMGIGLSQQLTDKFSYGLITKYVTEDFSVASEDVVAWDLGVLYNSGFKSIILAATVRNFGPQVKYETQSYPLPQTMNIGLSSHIMGADSPLLVESPTHDLLMTVDLVQPRDYAQQFNVGMEYSFRDLVYARTGYRINYDTEGFNFGLGFKLKRVALNYGYSDYGENLSGVHRFSIGFINI
ncbi:MAG: PorV/PorQ family protein [Candidatus Marinimicrobia bacterium]|nr:PorV/PorQ family protein [Candidatus Neomarinimicrobiota bacterium]